MAELSLLAKATLVLALGLMAARAASRAAASVRALLLTATFAAVVMLPVAPFVIPARPITIPETAAAASVFIVDGVGFGVTEDSPAVAVQAQSRVSILPAPAVMLRATWVVGSLLFLIPMAIAAARLRHLRRHGLRWCDWERVARQIGDHLPCHRRIELLLHEDLTAPITFGIRRAVIVFPADAPQWPDSETRRALVHELEHVRRFDWPVLVFARVVCAALWFHPLAWMAWRQLRLESERACDDAVVGGTDSAAYADQLVSLARRTCHVPAPMLSMASRSDLSTRVRAVLDAAQARGRVGMGTAAVVVALSAVVILALSPLQATAPAEARGQDAPPSANTTPRTFEVASIRPSTATTPRQTITQQGNTFIARNVTLDDLIVEAYGIGRVLGGPDWIGRDRFDIEAKPRDAATWNVQMEMLRGLLAERFKLTVRRESRDIPAYALVTAPHGPRLKVSTDDNCVPPPAGSCGGFRARPGELAGRHVTLPQLARLLSGPRTGRSVVDRTGVDGFYDIELRWTPDQVPRGPDGPDDIPAIDPFGPSIFTAIQEQLGLRLDAVVAPFDHLIIERAERPTPNNAPDATAPVAATAQADSVAPRFAVASIRRNTSGDAITMQILPGGRVTIVSTPVRILIRNAYRVQDHMIVDAPDWLASERYDIRADAEGNPTPDEMSVMLRTLLENRFQLRVRRQMREQEIYALVVDGPAGTLGPRLRPVYTNCAARRNAPPGPPQPPLAPDQAFECGFRMTAGSLMARSTDMRSLASTFSNVANRAVLDRTSLSGEFDVDLDWAPDSALGEVPSTTDRPSFFTAVREQLGLRLDAQRAPVDVLVIEQVERPSEN